MIPAGDLDKRVILEGRATAKNAAGEAVGEWAEIVTVWANIRPASSREILLTGSAASQATLTVTIRYRTGITAKNRVRFGTRILDVSGVINPDERNEELRLLCHETGGAS